MRKKVYCLIIIVFLLYLTGCGEEPKDEFAEELDKYYLNSHLQCTKEDEQTMYKIDIYQDKESKELVFGCLTESTDFYPYDEDGKEIEVDINELMCSDYEKDTFSKCKANTYIAGLGKETNRVRARYYYKIDVLNEVEDKEKALEVFKDLTEKDGYNCDIFD